MKNKISEKQNFSGYQKNLSSCRIYIETYGCSSNKNDSAIMSGLLNDAGYKIVNDLDSANLIILNTCIVKSVTENRIRFRVGELKKTGKNLIVAGCMAEAESETIRKIAPYASLVGTNSITRITEAVENMSNGKRVEFLGKIKIEKVSLPKTKYSPVIDIIEICSGCNYACSFCATKFAKGSLLNYSPDKILNDAKGAIADSCKELWITGQDVAAYNFNDTRLPELVEKLLSIGSANYFLRLGMMHPKSVMSILDELIDVYKNARIFKFIHLPVQSGSNAVLKAMGRNHTTEDFFDIVNAFRKKIPDITIWTDIIVGFPGENEDDFLQSIKLLERIKPDFTNVSCYGARPNTKAAKMKQLPTALKKQRTSMMSALASKLALEQNKKWIGWRGNIIIDEYKKNNWLGRNYVYKPVAVKGAFNATLGSTIETRIVDARKTCLIGEPIRI
ncbi:MAG: tRNA (N(6)-L-threonylcarbamoyladenosine(37)-C(2))-methylthiotransferase [Candidatus Aenigmatarchaeota archaeon]